MSSKYMINSVQDCIRESLIGFSKIHPHLIIDLENNVVFDAAARVEGVKVGVITGGGSGHEPFPPGYVGEGMLTASVSGAVFASPPSKRILRAIRLVASKFEEVLLVVPNYTGDVLNFGLAKETALEEGIHVESLIVGEDVAQITQGIATKAGRRGTCGIILMVKIAGFLAQKGETASVIKGKCEEIMKEMGSMGLCMSTCMKPGTGNLFQLREDEMELGVGVHGEAGVSRLSFSSAKEAVTSLLTPLISFLQIKSEAEVIVVVNNLGSLTYIEQWLLTGEVVMQLKKRKVQILRLYTGSFFTSLNMRGVQICILNLKEKNKELILSALDFATKASAWSDKVFSHFPSPDCRLECLESKKESEKAFSSKDETEAGKRGQLVEQCLIRISEDLINNEKRLNELDSFCGDGDCGSTFRSLAEVIQGKILEKKFNFSHPSSLFSQLSFCAEEGAGGTTGALYGLFLRGIANYIQKHSSFHSSETYAAFWREGVETIKKYSPARLGDRTMLDSLETACETFEKEVKDGRKTLLECFKKAVFNSEEGCKRTRLMKARAGRASYTDVSNQMHVDAGAQAVTIWLSSILKVLESNKDVK